MNAVFTGALLEAGTIGSTISLAITALTVAVILINVLYGMSRGMYKTAIRIVTIGLSIFVSYQVVRKATDYLHAMFVGQTVEGVITKVWPGYTSTMSENVRGIVNSFDAETVERLLATAAVILIIPIAFIVIFFAVKAVSFIVYAILHGILRVGKRKSPVSMLMGCALGVVQGLLVVWATLMPIAGLAGVAEEARDQLIADKEPGISQNIENAYVNYLDDVCANPILRMVQGFGGDQVFAAITTVEVADTEVDMRHEAKVLVEIVADGYPLIDGGFSWAELRDVDKRAMTAILGDIGSDDNTAHIVSGVMRGIATAHKGGYFNLSFEEPFKSFMDEFIHIFTDSDETNIEGDFKTFLDVYFILNDSRVLSHFGGGITDSTAEVLLAADSSGEKVITKVTNTLSANPRTAPLVTSLTKFSIQLMTASSGNLLPEGTDADQVYEDVKVGMVDVLASVNDDSIPAEEKHDAVKESLNQTLINSGVVTEENPLSDDAMNSITDYVMENYTGKEELTDDDINNALLAYYNQQGLVDGTIDDEDIGGVVDGVLGGGEGEGAGEE